MNNLEGIRKILIVEDSPDGFITTFAFDKDKCLVQSGFFELHDMIWDYVKETGREENLSLDDIEVINGETLYERIFKEGK